MKTTRKYPSFWTVLAIVMAILFFNGILKHSSGLGKNNSAEKIISEYASKNGFTLDDYPVEIREMLVLNEETKQFVTQYPEKISNFKPDRSALSEYKDCKTPPLLMQWDMRWGYMKYNNSVFGLTGSAPTCLSMAAIYVKQDTSLTPVHVAELSKGSGCEGRPEMLLSDGARAMGMSVSEVPRNNSRLRDAVTEEGCTVICMIKSQELSQFILIRGVDKDGNFVINDPASKKRSQESYSFPDLNKGIKRMWKYSLPSANTDAANE